MTSVIINGARTPMGRLLGNLKDLPATKLGVLAIRRRCSAPAWRPSRCST